MSLFIGAGVALVTPFKDNKVDYEKLGKLVEFHVNHKTDAIIVCGTTGESATMNDDERKEVIKFVVDKVNKRIPVIAGSGSNNTSHAVELSKYCESVGVDGLLVVTPYYNKGNEKGLYKHYETIAKSVKLPIILYNVPSRTGVNLKAEMVERLSHIENIIAVKEASGDISQVVEIARLCGEGFDIYSGNDDMIVPLLSLGGKGVISVVANILPEDTHDLVMKFIEGDVSGSRKMQLDMNALVNSLFIEVNPVPVKKALYFMGMIEDEVRLPLGKMSESNILKLKDEMKKYGLDV